MDDPIRKHDGQVLLYRRNGPYQARIHLGKGQYIHRSLKTAKRAEAERTAQTVDREGPAQPLLVHRGVQDREVSRMEDAVARSAQHRNGRECREGVRNRDKAERHAESRQQRPPSQNRSERTG